MPPLYPDRKPIPDTVKRAVRERAGNCCEECGDEGKLEFHHLAYLNTNSNYHRDWFGLIFGAETHEDLALLCRECHHQQHRDLNGYFWADPDDHPERNMV